MKKNRILKKFSAFLLFASQSLLLAGIVLIAVFPSGCKLTEIPSSLSGDYETPVINQFIVRDEFTVEVYFSEKVVVSDSSIPCEEKEDDDSVIVFTLPQASVPGKKYVLTGQVEDNNGNSLTFSIPFTGFNSRVPKIIMSEIQTESVSSRTAFEKSQDFYKTEFIEIVALSDGNLSGLEIVSVHDGEDKKFVFPDVEVKTGEIFTVHLRKRGNGCISETGDDFSLASAPYTSDNVRDLWSESESTALGNKTDIVFIRNSADGSILDAVMYTDGTQNEWKETYASYAKEVKNAGIYESDEISLVTDAGGKTNSKTISRSRAGVLRKLALNKEIVEYPVKTDAYSWTVTSASCGTVD